MGYGRIKWGRRHERAHRLAYQLHHGIELPQERRVTKSSVVVLHTCDNRACCNPAHLWLGTLLDNNLDCALKGRGNNARGDKHGANTHPERVKRGSSLGHAKLTEYDVLVIRDRLKAGERHIDIALSYGLRRQTVSDINERRTWKHV